MACALLRNIPSKQDMSEGALGPMSKIFQAFLANETAIRRVFRRYFRSAEDVEDLTQQVFMKCFAAEMKADIREPKFFLLRAAKNLAIGELRKKVRTTTDSIELSGGADVFVDSGSLTAETHLDSKQKLAALAAAMARLPAKQRRAFWLRKVEGLKLSQIAERMDVAQSTAKKYVGDALLACEADLRARGYDMSEIGARPSSPPKVAARAANDTGPEGPGPKGGRG